MDMGLDRPTAGDRIHPPPEQGSAAADDPALGIDWGVAAPSLSARDAAGRALAEVDNLPVYEG
jgi:dTDP-4-dehydrorhamnose 3,5-epimerase